MHTLKRAAIPGIVLLAGMSAVVITVGGSASGQPPGKGKGAGDPAMKADMEVFHFLLDNRADIRRTVKLLPNGVETVTESDKPGVTKKIQEHVAAMHERVKSGKGIHLRDPLFAEIFKNYDKVVLKVEKTDKGVKVTETSDEPKVAKLIQVHAEVVSKFIENGHEEVRKHHSLPTEQAGLVFPVIKHHGGIVALPAAEDQPRKGAKVVFDVTGGADAAAVNPGLERAARLLNLYGAAGLTAKDVKIVVVLHGDATKAALGEVGYAKHFKGEKNPNAALLRDLDQAGVTVLVCGQALHAKGFSTDEVALPVRVAVSAMTAVTNRQTEGYVYFPIPATSSSSRSGVSGGGS
jgi:intracellular sulfur oxidation DsrE/DsrF family protein